MTERSQPYFSQLNIVAGDPEASLRFYRRLGIDIPDNAIWKTPSGTHHVTAQARPRASGASLDIDSTVFAREWNNGWKDRQDLAGRVVIGFQVPSRSEVDATYDKMTTTGYRGLQAPYDAIWGARYAVIEDPDGIAVGIMSPVSAENKSPPPAI